ncbi:tyrosine-type recombinase/integrase [Burkholderia sp. Ac-20344]|uniref:tyrosine-type recombinase/integrase n=1 Tax=Burkholderia sp. Ac-20344 TaxID=2703890 RepID=UPI00197C7540|nr:tyrosine-type recombinase/integrase [Burkholderia sp. Ac-20344]MBN3831039.1 tyrosine-type recombinase/integrase [Burkholderia sp. Ac-20344]
MRWKLPDSFTAAQLNKLADRWRNRQAAHPTRTDGEASRTAYVSTATSWLRFLGRLQAPTSEQHGSEQIAAYARFMRDERNLSALTIRTRCGRASEFLRLADAEGYDIHQLDWRAIDLILASKGSRDGLTRASMQTYGYSIRSFIRYLEEHGHCRLGLSSSIQPPRVYQGEALPAGPSWPEVLRVLEKLVGDRPGAIRDRAVMMMFAVYGLRVAEVRRLRLDDFDWQQALVRIHRSKQSPHVAVFPLAGDVADALARYLRFVRVKSDRREVFLQLRSPYQPLGSSALWQIVNRQLRPMDLSIKHTGPHALRHACATQLLGRGLTMKEIGDFLGHCHPATTAIYAKVDIEGLRRVADVDLGRFL